MKTRTFASLIALLVLGIAAQQSARAQAASGTYQFSFEDKYVKYTEFSAQTQPDGSATGTIFLSDEAPLTYRDLDGTGDPTVKYAGFYIKANVDALKVINNKAVMSGTVYDSSVRELMGLRVLLTVEDNGDNTRVPDKLTWGVYKESARDWTPSDAELKIDPGVGMTWLATDAEVRGDEGYKMPRDERITVQSFPLATYDFVDVVSGAGDITVRA